VRPQLVERVLAECFEHPKPGLGAGLADRLQHALVDGRVQSHCDSLGRSVVEERRADCRNRSRRGGARESAQPAKQRALRLVESTVSTTGVVIGSYEPAGDVQTGSLA
jgi:hypothetical protein